MDLNLNEDNTASCVAIFLSPESQIWSVPVFVLVAFCTLSHAGRVMYCDLSVIAGRLCKHHLWLTK